MTDENLPYDLVWLMMLSPLTLAITVAAAIAFVLCVAYGNRRDGW
jgi:hypothetical protein